VVHRGGRDPAYAEEQGVAAMKSPSSKCAGVIAAGEATVDL